MAPVKLECKMVTIKRLSVTRRKAAENKVCALMPLYWRFLTLVIVQDASLPPLMRTRRIPTPAWAVAADRKSRVTAESKRQIELKLNHLPDLHFTDFEGNVGVQRARSAILTSPLRSPKGWGQHHTHVLVSNLPVQLPLTKGV